MTALLSVANLSKRFAGHMLKSPLYIRPDLCRCQNRFRRQHRAADIFIPRPALPPAAVAGRSLAFLPEILLWEARKTPTVILIEADLFLEIAAVRHSMTEFKKP